MNLIFAVLLVASAALAKGPDSQTSSSSAKANAKGAARARANAAPGDASWRYNEQGNDAANQGAREAALNLYAKAVNADPGNWSAQQNYGRALYFFDRWEEAERHTLAGLKLKPDQPQPYDIMARLRSKQGRFEEGLDFARKGRALDPGFDERRFVFMETYLLNCLTQSDAAVLAAGEPSPADASNLIYERTRAYLESGRATEAISESRRLEKSHRQVAIAVRGEALVLLGRYDEAAAAAAQCGEDEAYIMGFVARARGDKAEARRQFMKARALFAANRVKLNGARKCGKDYIAVVDAELAKL